MHRKKQKFVQIMLLNTAIAPLWPLFDNILYLKAFLGTIWIHPNSSRLLRHYTCYLTTLQNTNNSLCIPLSFQPLGYKVDDTKLKRAGLDYWPYPWIYASLMLKPLSHLHLLCYLIDSLLTLKKIELWSAAHELDQFSSWTIPQFGSFWCNSV